MKTTTKATETKTPAAPSGEWQPAGGWPCQVAGPAERDAWVKANKRYKIVTLSGNGLPTGVDATGYDTHLAAREQAHAFHDGDFAVLEDTTITLTTAAQENVEETGCNPLDDVDAIRTGKHTRESLLAHCLDGAEPDREQGWREYVDAICEAAAS